MRNSEYQAFQQIWKILQIITTALNREETKP